MALDVVSTKSELANIIDLCNRTLSSKTGLVFNDTDYTYEHRNTGIDGLLIIKSNPNNPVAWNLSQPLQYKRLDLVNLHEVHLKDTELMGSRESGVLTDSELTLLCRELKLIKSSINAEWVSKTFMPGMGYVYIVAVSLNTVNGEDTYCYTGECEIWVYKSMVDLAKVNGALGGFDNFPGVGTQTVSQSDTSTYAVVSTLTDRENIYALAEQVFSKPLSRSKYRPVKEGDIVHLVSTPTDNLRFKYVGIDLNSFNNRIINRPDLLWETFEQDAFVPDNVSAFIKQTLGLPSNLIECRWVSQEYSDAVGAETTTTVIEQKVKLSLPEYLTNGCFTVTGGEATVTLTRTVEIKTYNLPANKDGIGFVNLAMRFGNTTPKIANGLIFPGKVATLTPTGLGQGYVRKQIP